MNIRILRFPFSVVPSHPSYKDNYEFEAQDGQSVNRSFVRTRERKTDSFDNTLEFQDNSGTQSSSSGSSDSLKRKSSSGSGSSEESKSNSDSSSSSRDAKAAIEETKESQPGAAQTTKNPSPNFSNIANHALRRR